MLSIKWVLITIFSSELSSWALEQWRPNKRHRGVAISGMWSFSIRVVETGRQDHPSGYFALQRSRL